MELNGEQLIPASQERTWQSLNDTEVLKACIPGCETLERTEEGGFTATMSLRIGPVSAKFKGKLTLSEVQAPTSYTMHFDGQGGMAGFGKGSAQVHLAPADGGTKLSYAAKAQVGGKLAQVGSRLVDAAAGKITNDFFAAFNARVQADAAAAGEVVPTVVDSGPVTTEAVAAAEDGSRTGDGGLAVPADRPTGSAIERTTPARPAWVWWAAAAAIAALVAVILGACAPRTAQAQQPARFIVVASTTSTEQSGLFAHLLPAFKQASGIEARVIALGTGQALDTGRRGDADVVFVHDQVAEEKFVAEGFGIKRQAVMFNDFILVGPKHDPAAVKGRDIAEGLRKLAAGKEGFVSRGDKSGTHAAEVRFWRSAGIDVATAKPAGYAECGCGMGPALNIAASKNAYVLTDRGTWLNFKNRAELAVLVEGDQRLFNQYGVIVVNPAKHAHVKSQWAQAFADWLVSPAGQASIAAYRIGGEQLFFPNAKP